MQINARRRSIVIWVIIIGLLTLPAIISLLFIRVFGVNVCYLDQWGIVPLFDRIYTGQISFTELFAQHNEHRIFFPRLVMLSLGYLAQFNNLAEMYFSWLLIFITCIVLLKFYIRYFGTTKRAIASFIPVTWLIFSLRQWENLLWGFQIGWFMVILFLVLALYLLATTSRPGWRFGLAVISACVCSFSSAQGLLIWPIGLIQLLLTWWTQRKGPKWPYIKMVSIWFMIGILAYTVYFVGYNKPPYHPDLLYFLSNPFSAITYLLVVTGSPLAFDMTSAIGVGILVLPLYIFVVAILIYRKLIISPYVPFFLSLILFALFTAAILLLSRAGFGAGQAFSSRYTSMTMLGIIGLYLIIIPIEINDKIKLFISGSVITLIVLGTLTTYFQAIVTDGKNIRDDRTMDAEYLANIEVQSDGNIEKLHPSHQWVIEQANILKKYRLNVFSPDFIYLYKIIDAKQLIKLRGLSWIPTGGWSSGGTYIKETPDAATYTYGSWGGADKNVGVLKSSPIRVEGPEYLVMYVMTGPRTTRAISSNDLRSINSLIKYIMKGPSPTGQTVGLDTNCDGEPDILYQGNAELRWDQWVVDLTPYINKDISIVAIDDGTESGEWMGVSEPFIVPKHE